MSYAKIESGAVSKYPYTFLDLKRDYPNTSFPKSILEQDSSRSELGVELVVETDVPSRNGYTPTEEVPYLSGTSWVQNWNLVPKKAQDVTENEVENVEEPVQDGYLAVTGTPELVDGVWKQTWIMQKNTWLENRVAAYGNHYEQIEFITENGLEAWQTKVAEIKARYPKE